MKSKQEVISTDKSQYVFSWIGSHPLIWPSFCYLLGIYVVVFCLPTLDSATVSKCGLPKEAAAAPKLNVVVPQIYPRTSMVLLLHG